jgi:hypothetical protein
MPSVMYQHAYADQYEGQLTANCTPNRGTYHTDMPMRAHTKVHRHSGPFGREVGAIVAHLTCSHSPDTDPLTNVLKNTTSQATPNSLTRCQPMPFVCCSSWKHHDSSLSQHATQKTSAALQPVVKTNTMPTPRRHACHACIQPTSNGCIKVESQRSKCQSPVAPLLCCRPEALTTHPHSKARNTRRKAHKLSYKDTNLGFPALSWAGQDAGNGIRCSPLSQQDALEACTAPTVTDCVQQGGPVSRSSPISAITKPCKARHGSLGELEPPGKML